MLKTLLVALCMLVTHSAAAQDVRLVVQSGAGNSIDQAARKLAVLFGELGSVIVENKNGGAGIIAAEYVARANPDGRTIFVGQSGIMGIMPHMRKLSFDPFTDFEPVAPMLKYRPALVVGPGIPADDFASYRALVLKDPKTYGLYGSTGTSTPPHLLSMRFANMSGLPLTYVPSKNATDAVTSLVGTQLPAAFVLVSDVFGQPSLRILAVSGTERSPVVPAAPTFSELGMPITQELWCGLYVPKGTPKEVIARISALTQRALKTPEFRDWILMIGMEPFIGTAEELRAYHVRDSESWKPLVAPLAQQK